MKRALKIIGILVAAAIVIPVGGIVLAQNGIDNPVSNLTGQAANSTINSVIDASGIKEKAEEALRDNAGNIAQATGLPVTAVNSMIDGLDIQSWEVTSLPRNAQETGSADVEFQGTNATLITYDDPSVLTVATDGGSVTVKVPPSAQGYVEYLDYL